MKLTLVIVVGIGFHLCAVSAMHPCGNSLRKSLLQSDGQSSQSVLKGIEDKFDIMIAMCICDDEYLPWSNLKHASKEFKKNCIDEFRDKTGFDVNDCGLASKCENYPTKASTAVKYQMLHFTEKLLRQLPGLDSDTIVKLDICCDERLLGFIQFWFFLNCDENELKKAIQVTKIKHKLRTNKAAEVLFVLEKFPVHINLNDEMVEAQQLFKN